MDHEFIITPMSEWQTPEWVLSLELERCVGVGNGHSVGVGKIYRLIKTSPGPGTGMSSSSILVEIEPGLSYTAALYFLGRSVEAMIARCLIDSQGLCFEKEIMGCTKDESTEYENVSKKKQIKMSQFDQVCHNILYPSAWTPQAFTPRRMYYRAHQSKCSIAPTRLLNRRFRSELTLWCAACPLETRRGPRRERLDVTYPSMRGECRWHTSVDMHSEAALTANDCRLARTA